MTTKYNVLFDGKEAYSIGESILNKAFDENFYEFLPVEPISLRGKNFDETTIVFKVGNKMFALSSIINFEFVNLKCDPEQSIELRETFQGIKPGWHMSKKHWNTVDVESDVSQKLFLELIDHSYDLVLKTLTKKVRDEL